MTRAIRCGSPRFVIRAISRNASVMNLSEFRSSEPKSRRGSKPTILALEPSNCLGDPLGIFSVQHQKAVVVRFQCVKKHACHYRFLLVSRKSLRFPQDRISETATEFSVWRISHPSSRPLVSHPRKSRPVRQHSANCVISRDFADSAHSANGSSFSARGSRSIGQRSGFIKLHVENLKDAADRERFSLGVIGNGFGVCFIEREGSIGPFRGEGRSHFTTSGLKKKTVCRLPLSRSPSGILTN